VNAQVLVLMTLTVVMVIPSTSVIGSGPAQPTLPGALVASHSDAIVKGSQALPGSGNGPANAPKASSNPEQGKTSVATPAVSVPSEKSAASPAVTGKGSQGEGAPQVSPPMAGSSAVPTQGSSGTQGPQCAPGCGTGLGVSSPPGELPQTSSVNPAAGGGTSPPVYEPGAVVATVGVGSWPLGVAYDSGNGLVYVANSYSNSVSVISGTTNTVVATVGVGSYPWGVGYDAGNGYVYETNSGSNTVSVISGTTVVATVVVGTQPSYVAYDGGNGYVYVGIDSTNVVKVISGTTVVATVGVGNSPTGIAWDSGNGDLYVANAGSGNVTVVSGATNKVVANIATGSLPDGAVYDSGNGDVYVANYDSNSVSVISGISEVAGVSDPEGPYALAYDSGNGYVYAANPETVTVSVISGTDVLGDVTVGNGPDGVGYDSGNGQVYAANSNSNSVSVISTLLDIGSLGGNMVSTSSSLVGTVTVGSYPYAVGYDSGNGDVYVVNQDSNSVSVISGTTVVGTVTVGANPWAVGYDSGNGDIYVVNNGANSVSVISGTTVVGTVTVGSNPYAVGYDSGNGEVYVVNQDSNSVSVISGTTVVGTVAVGSYPWAVGYDSGNGDIYVSNFGGTTVSVISGTTVGGTVTVGSEPIAVGYDSGNGDIYVANYDSSSVSVISGTTVVGTVTVGSYPDAAGYDSGNGDIYMANQDSNSVSVIFGTMVVGTVAVGANPWAVVYDGGNGDIYVLNLGANSVSVISTAMKITSPPTLEMDVGQFMLLNAPLLFLNPGVSSTSVTVSPSSGLSCTALDPTLAGVSMLCVATSPGSYGVTLYANDTAGSGVWTSTTVTVFSDPTVTTPIPTRSGADVGQVVVISTSASGGPGSYSYYAWSAPWELGCAASTSNTLTCLPMSPVSSGQVEVNVTDANDRTSADASLTFTVSADPTITSLAAAPASIDVGQSTSLTATSTPGSGAPVYSWSGLPAGCANANSLSLTCAPMVSGTFAVSASVQDSNGYNVSSSTFTLVVSPALGTAGLSASRTALDVGQAVGLVTVISGGTQVYTYAWTGLPPGCVSANAASVGCTPSSSGTYSVRAWTNDSNGASSSATVTLTVSADPTIMTPLANRTALDVGQSASLLATATNGTGLTSTYAWQGLPAGCASANALSLSCDPAVPGTYAVTVSITDSNGYAVTSGTVTMVVSPALGTAVLSLSRTTIDVGQTVTLVASASAGSGAYSYGWAGLPSGCVGANAATLTCVPSSAGSYTIWAWTNDSNIATSSATVTLVVSADPTISTPGATLTTLDIGQSTDLSASATNGTGGASTYAWSGLPAGCLSANSLSLSCSPTETGTFTVSVSIMDSNGYYVSSPAIVLVVSPALGTAVLTLSRTALDVRQSVTLVASASAGSGAYSYGWAGLPSGCVGANAATLTCVPSFAPSSAGSYTIWVWTNDSNGVSSSASVTLTVSVDPTISTPAATKMTLDLGQSTVLTTEATNGTGLHSAYLWEGLPAGCTSYDTLSFSCSPTVSGTFSVTVSVTDSNRLTVVSGPMVLTISPALTAPALAGSATAVDVGQSVTLSVTVSGGGLPYTYAWTGLPKGCVSTNAATLVCNPSVAGSSFVSVTVTDANGVYLSSSPFNLTVSARLMPGSITLTSGTLDLGQGTKLTVSVTGGSGGLSYAWSGLPSGCASANAAQLSCTPGAAGESWVSVEVTDSNGAVVSVGPVSLTVFTALGTPTIAASVSSLQVGSSVTLTVDMSGGAAPLSYSWSGLPAGCASVNSPVLTCVPTATGSFTASVTVTDAAGASATATASPVTVSSVPSQGFASGTNGLEWTVLAIALIAVLIGSVALVLLMGKRGAAPPAEKAKGTPETTEAREDPASPSSGDSSPPPGA